MPPKIATIDKTKSALSLDEETAGVCTSAMYLRYSWGHAGRPGGSRTPNLRFWRPPLCQLSYWPNSSAVLFENLGHHAGADGAAALADGEAQLLLHRDRGDQRHHHLDVVARHHHLGARRELERAGHVGRAEIELRPVAVEKRRVAAALFL